MSEFALETHTFHIVETPKQMMYSFLFRTSSESAVFDGSVSIFSRVFTGFEEEVTGSASVGILFVCLFRTVIFSGVVVVVVVDMERTENIGVFRPITIFGFQ
jgi:hypothetical protein